MPSIIPPPGLCCPGRRCHSFPLTPTRYATASVFNNLQNSVSKYVPLGTSKCGVATNYPSMCRDCKFMLKTAEINVSYYWKAVSKYVSFSVWL